MKYHGDGKVESDIYQANLFADFFSSVHFESNSSDYGTLSTNCSFPILEELIINGNFGPELCKTTDDKESRGPDDLSVIIQELCTFSRILSAKYLRKFSQTSTNPESWKQSIVVPIHK